MNRSTPGLPVHHQLLEFPQTHVHRVGDAIQPSHPLSSPSPPAPNLSQHQGLFKWVSSSHPVAKVLEFQLQHQSFQWTPRTNLYMEKMERLSVWYRLLVFTYMCSFTVLQFKYFLAPLVSVMWLSSGQWTSSADHDIFQVDFHSLFSQATLLKMKDSKGLKYATTGEKELELLSHCLEGRYIRFCKTRNKVCHWKLLFVFYSS